MEERLLELLESVLGSYKKTSGDNYAFYSPFVDHYKPKLEINIQINSKGNNPWHCWISDEKGRSIKTLFRKLRRGLRPEDIVKYNIGYCEEGEYRDKIIIPSYDDSGKLNFFVGRSFYQTEYKHKNPKVSKDIVGFDLLINWDTPLVLCEGAFDAISVRRNAIPLFGKAIQSELEKKIIGNSVKKLYIVLDSDAIKNAIGLAKKFMSYGIETHLVDMGDEDASEMGYDRINKKIYDTPPLDLRKLMEYQLFKV